MSAGTRRVPSSRFHSCEESPSPCRPDRGPGASPWPWPSSASPGPLLVVHGTRPHAFVVAEPATLRYRHDPVLLRGRHGPSRRAWTPLVPWTAMAEKSVRRMSRGGAGPRRRAHRSMAVLRDTSAASGHRGWLAFAVVVGLFAMHGLALHGLHGSEASSSMSAGSTSSADPRLAAHGHEEVAAQVAPSGADKATMELGSAMTGASTSSGGVGILGLCLTLLSLGVLWLCRSTGGRRWWTVRRRALESCAVHLSATARNLSPPLRAELSIWRC